jgi:hypothetical protein
MRPCVLWAAAALVLALCGPALQARAEFHTQDWELTLAGSARNDSDFSESSIGKSGSLGYFPLRDLELSIRDTITYTDVGRDTLTDIRVATAVDWHFPLGRSHRFIPFVGATLGYQFGNGVLDTWYAGPEAGIKYFVNNDAFLFFRAEYDIFFDTTGDSSSDSQFVYQFGIGFRF